jgi:hypothetical protein
MLPKVLRRARDTVVVAAVVAVAVAGMAWATHQFSDVPTGAVYHDAASWLAARAVTLGCAAGLYCPNDLVTRGQMALFMNRLGAMLSPKVRIASASYPPGTFDPDTNPVLCWTLAYAAAYPQRAYVHAGLTVFGVINLSGVRAYAAYSTDDGGTWTNLDAVPSTATGSGSNFAYSARDLGVLDLNVGQSYRFGVRVTRYSGDPAQDGQANCQVRVMIANRNPDGAVPDGSASTTRR